jgi:hypothetical protein
MANVSQDFSQFYEDKEPQSIDKEKGAALFERH